MVLQSIKHTFCSLHITCFYITYSNIQRHVSMPAVFSHIHRVNSATKIPVIKLEQERTFDQIPSISAIVFEISISFPWQ